MGSSCVKWVRLGDYIEQCDERNHNNQYSIEIIKGISTNKLFIDTKANLDGVPLQSYKLVSPRYFAYVPDTSRRGDKVALAFNNSGDTCLISSIYCVFKVAKPIELVPEYLYLFFLRPEFDRYARYNSWGSAREVFSYSSSVCCRTAESGERMASITGDQRAKRGQGSPAYATLPKLYPGIEAQISDAENWAIYSGM